MKKLLLSKLDEWLTTLSETQRIILPIKQTDQVNFGVYAPGAEVSLETLRTVKSAKDAFFPQVENMMNFRSEGKSISVETVSLEEEDFILMGVRGCDEKSFEILDRVFLSDPFDPFYAARRKHATIVTLACSRPDENCFCTNFGVDPTNPKGDVTSWIVDGTLYLTGNTEKGEALIASLEDANDEPVAAQQNKTREILEKLPFAHLDLNGFDGDHLMEKFSSSKWADLSEACLGCGTCTFVCPTCQCYDIRDYDTGRGVQRYRCWDSCMYSDFTLMAHGTNRPTQVERFRQRFMHKLVYFPSNNDGMYSCVGCGRCLVKCPQNLNIVKVIKALGGDRNDN